jgi:hypothetical protein
MQFTMTIEGLQGLVVALTAAGADVQPLMALAAKASVQEVQRTARLMAPHRTGTLQRSIQIEGKDLIQMVTVGEKYGLYLEEGTKPHDIYPRNKKALFWPGALHPVSVVHNPGVKARPWFKPAIEASQPFIESQFVKVTETLSRQIAAYGGRG